MVLSVLSSNAFADELLFPRSVDTMPDELEFLCCPRKIVAYILPTCRTGIMPKLSEAVAKEKW